MHLNNFDCNWFEWLFRTGLFRAAINNFVRNVDHFSRDSSIDGIFCRPGEEARDVSHDDTHPLPQDTRFPSTKQYNI
jgi:hypothetical protein